jgi:hypothetical protein
MREGDFAHADASGNAHLPTLHVHHRAGAGFSV